MTDFAPIDLAPYDRVRAVRYAEDHLELLDQRLLPARQEWLSCLGAADTAQAITDLVVRGAPAIGIAAAYGAALAARQRAHEAADEAEFRRLWDADLALLQAARPTAVNLAWALHRVHLVCTGLPPEQAAARALAEAVEISAEDLAANYRMAELGAAYLANGSGVLTHCNTGSRATGGLGTALGVIRAGVASGRIAAVYSAETRPWLQGSRLTLWELLEDGIEAQLIADGAGAWLIASGKVHWVITGADRVCANGDVANKIGTLAHAVAARHFGARFMVVCPWSTVDLHTADGSQIEIEERSGEELLGVAGQRIAAAGAQAWNPVFDVTPADLVDVLVTERGAIEKPDREKIAALR
jgi:methylthioribose-1-phosphate isomerase